MVDFELLSTQEKNVNYALWEIPAPPEGAEPDLVMSPSGSRKCEFWFWIIYCYSDYFLLPSSKVWEKSLCRRKASKNQWLTRFLSRIIIWGENSPQNPPEPVTNQIFDTFYMTKLDLKMGSSNGKMGK